MRYYIEFKTKYVKGEAVVHHEPVEGALAVVEESAYLELKEASDLYLSTVAEQIDIVAKVLKGYRILLLVTIILGVWGWLV